MPVLPDIPTISTDITLDDLVERTRDYLAEQGADFYGDEAEIIPALNEARFELFSDLRALPTSYSAVSTPDVASVPAPDDFSMWDTLMFDGRELKPIFAIEYAKLAPASGTPTQFVMWTDAAGNDHVLLYPTPNTASALTGVYYRIPPELTQDQGPAWHQRFAFLPCLFAAASLLHKDNLPEKAQFFEAKWAMGKAQYKSWLVTRQPWRESVRATVPKQEV